MGGTNTCRTALLSDLPSDNDAFGSHAPIADAIAGMVKSEEGGHVIALDGPWGSGKSTVITLLRARLRGGQDDRSPCQTLVFDAWSHRGDPLRRTFLEWLIAELGAIGWVAGSEQRWEDLRDRLSKRRQKQRVTKTPSLTTLGWIMSVLYLLTPVGMGLFLKVGDKEWTGGLVWLSRGGLVVLVLPFLLVLVAMGWRALNKQPYQEALALLVKSSTEVTESETIQTLEPTSIEFQSFFQQIVAAALPGSKPDRRLVLVIDNLDRMCSDDSLAIWATMRTFFDFNRDEERSWLRQFWLVVPYDHRSLVQLWGPQKGPGANSTRSTSGEAGAQTHDEPQTARSAADGSMAESFIEKTFQVRFHVPPPVPSDWGSMLERALAKALPDHKEGERHNVYRIYSAYRTATGAEASPPTPRELKMLVNDLGGVHRQWCQTGIPLVDQAFYVLLVRAMGQQQLVERLRDPQYLMRDLGSGVLSIVSDSWHRRLVAMSFNVPESKAMQVLIGEGVAANMAAGDVDALRSDAAFEGFRQVCEQVVTAKAPDWAREDAAQLARAAFAVAALDMRPEADPSWAQVCRALCSAARGVSRWDLAAPLVADGLIAFSSLDASSEFLEAMVTAASVLQSSGRGGPQPEGVPAGPWADGAGRLLRGLIERGDEATEQILSEKFQVVADATIYRMVMQRVRTFADALELARFLRPSVATSDVTRLIAEEWDAGKAEPEQYTLIPILSAAMPGADWGLVVDALNRVLVATESTQPQVAAEGIGTLLALEALIPTARDVLRQLGPQGFLLHWFSARHELPPAVRGRIAFAFLRDAQNLPQAGHIASSPEGQEQLQSILASPGGSEEIVAAFADLVRAHAALDLVFRLCGDGSPSVHFGAAVLRELLHRERPFDVLPSTVIVERASALRTALGPQGFQELLHRAVHEADLRGVLVGQQFEAVPAQLHREVLAIQGGSSESRYHALLKSGFGGLSSEQWQTMLASCDPVIALLADAVKQGLRLNLGTLLRDGIENYSRRILDRDIEYPQKALVPIFRDVLSALSEDSRRDLLSRIAKRLAQHDNVIGPFLSLYGQFLLDDLQLLRVDPKHTVDVLFRHILEEREDAGIDWMAQVLTKDPKLFHDRAESTKTDFANRLREARGVVSESSREQIKEIARELGLELDASEAVDAAEPEGAAPKPHDPA